MLFNKKRLWSIPKLITLEQPESKRFSYPSEAMRSNIIPASYNIHFRRGRRATDNFHLRFNAHLNANRGLGPS